MIDFTSERPQMDQRIIDSSPIPSYALAEFSQLLQREPDVLASHPCLVRGFNAQWRASELWTQMSYLEEKFGHLPVTAGAPQFVTHAGDRMCQVFTDFGTYLKYMADPGSVETLFEGKWSKGDAALFRDMDMPLYCGNMRLARHAKEPVFDDLRPIIPEGLACYNDDIPYYYQSGNHLWLYVSLAGALTPLHQDNNAVIAYLAQLKGRKQAILYSPEDKPHYFNPAVGYLDPLHPDDGEFPTWRQARAWTGTIEAGDFLIWGPNWAHHVVTQSDSITVSYDVVNDLNLEAYAASMDWRNELGLFATKNEALIRSRIADASVHRALDSGNSEDIGREVMRSVLRAALAGNQSETARAVRTRLLRVLDEA